MFTCNFALRQCTEYFVSRGSTVFMAALDAKKAFDRVNHMKLFHLMCDIGVPVHIIRLLMIGPIEKALEKLKTGKASGIDGIVKEHLV